MLNVNEERAIYCLKAENEKYPEICDECKLHGMIGCDHCFDEAADVAINALEKLEKIKEEFRVWNVDTHGYFGAAH